MTFTTKQREYLKNANHRWNIKCGATRSGKTYLDYYLIPKRIRHLAGKDGTVLLLGNTKGTLQRNVIEPMQKIWGSTLVGDMRADGTVFLFDEKAYCLGADKTTQVDRLRGSSVKYCYGDEIVSWHEDVFNMLKSRLDKEYSLFDGTCNPGAPNHWLKKFIDSGAGHYNDTAGENTTGGADIFYQQYSIFDNEFLPAAVRDNMIKEHTGVFYQRHILGQWALAEGLIYSGFANNPSKYVRVLGKEELKDVQFVSIGIDFGGSRSLTTFVASGIHANFSRVTVIDDYHIKGHKGEIDAARVCTEFIAFTKRLQKKYPYLYIKYVWADNEAQYLINSLRRACGAAGITAAVNECKKRRILERIIAGNTLINTGRLTVGDECVLVTGGLTNAVWDAKNVDERLDNFSTDIDILDAFEYSWEAFIQRLIAG